MYGERGRPSGNNNRPEITHLFDLLLYLLNRPICFVTFLGAKREISNVQMSIISMQTNYLYALQSLAFQIKLQCLLRINTCTVLPYIQININSYLQVVD